MLNLSLLRETRVYQEAKEEGKLEGKLKVVSKLLEKGLSLQEVAEIVEIDIETIRQSLKKL